MRWASSLFGGSFDDDDDDGDGLPRAALLGWCRLEVALV